MSLIFATQLTAVATAVLAAFAIVTAWYARRAFLKQSREVSDQARMLEIQADQFAEDRKVNAEQIQVLKLQAKDLRKSLKERTRHQRTAEREQAAKIGFRMTSIPFPAFSQEDASEFAVAPGETVHMAIVSNESHRPIKSVVCKAANLPETEPLIAPDYSYSAVMVGRLVNQRFGPEREPPNVSLIEEIPTSRARRIRPGEAYGFVFEIKVHRHLMDSEVARFTDDAGLNWQIDHDLHLKPLHDRDW